MKDKTKAKIQELCPDVIEANCEEGEMHYCSTHRGYLPPVLTLAVVLRVIHEAMEIKRYLTKGYFSGDRINPYEANILDAVAFWDPKHDNYDDQTQETKDFLATLLS